MNKKTAIIIGIIVLAIAGFFLFNGVIGSLLGAILAPLLGGDDKTKDIEANKVKAEEADNRQEHHEEKAAEVVTQANEKQEERIEVKPDTEQKPDDEFIKNARNSGRTI